MKLVLIILFAFLTAALVEYFLHKFHLHKATGHAHIRKHHKIFHPKNSYADKTANKEEIFSGKLYVISNAVLYFPVALIVASQSRFLGSLFFMVAFSYTIWIEVVHLFFHKPSGMFFERNILFKKLKEHHKVHHDVYDANYGIGSSVWDWILGSKK